MLNGGYMSKIISSDSPIITALSKLTDIMFLNIMWLVGCLPIVTVGASTTALYRSVRKYKEYGYFPKGTFWHAYRENFKQATILSFAVLVALGFVTIDLYVVLFSTMDAGLLNILIFAILALAVTTFVGYVFPLQAHFENKVIQTLKNAWLISIIHLPMSVVIAIINFFPVILALAWPEAFLRSIILWLLFGGAAIAYVNDGILNCIFKNYYSPEIESDSTF